MIREWLRDDWPMLLFGACASVSVMIIVYAMPHPSRSCVQGSIEAELTAASTSEVDGRLYLCRYSVEKFVEPPVTTVQCVRMEPCE